MGAYLDKSEVVVDIVGWYCVFRDGESFMVVKDKHLAEHFIEFQQGQGEITDYQIQPITRKTEKTHSFVNVNEELIKRGIA